MNPKRAFPAVGARYLIPTGASASSHWVLLVNQPRTSKTGVTATAGSGVLTLQHASSTSVTVMGVNGPLKTQPLLSRKTRPLSRLPSSVFFFFFFYPSGLQPHRRLSFRLHSHRLGCLNAMDFLITGAADDRRVLIKNTLQPRRYKRRTPRGTN